MKGIHLFALSLVGIRLAFSPFLSAASAPPTDRYMLHDENTLEVLTPSLAERQTAKLRLDNGLEAYLVSDPQATRSAAALAVNVGSWMDPEDYPGLAHFCEHMLFLGTEKYPIESEYDRYITENAGNMNAYTAHDHTNYMFAVKHDAFDEALDRFSWFFKKPLFNESGVDREVQAIDQEYAKNVPQDHIRQIYIAKELANPKHPHARFNMGNAKSLKNANPDVLRAWYDKHYSSHLMHLVIYSSLPIQELVDMAEEKFSGIPRREAEIFRTDQALLGEATKHQVIHYTPLKDLRTISFTWELPAEFAGMLETQPERIIGSILGHEDEKSLLAELKREDLAEGLSSGGYRMGPDNFVFRVSIELTDQGIRRTEDVQLRMYEAIASLRETPPLPYLFEEIQRMETLHYQYQSREDAFDFVAAHTREMLQEDIVTYPMKSRVIQRYDAAATQRFIAALLPEKCMVIVTAKPQVSGKKPDRHEEWIGGDYTLAPIPQKLLTRLNEATANPKIALSPPNPFIPNDLKVLGTRKPYEGTPHPTLLSDDNRGRIYFLQDELYLVPEIYWKFRVRTPAVRRGNVQEAALTDLYVRSLTEELNSLSYTALLAGLQFAIEPAADGLEIAIQGYSDKAGDLLDAILARIKTVRPSDQQFRTYKNSLRRKYENFRKESPFTQGYQELKGVLHKDFVKQADKAKSIRGISYEQFLNFASNLWRQAYIEGMLYGNMEELEADKLWSEMANGIASSPFPKKAHDKPKIIHLPQEKGPFFLTHRIKEPGNAVILTIQNGDFSFEARAAQQIIAKGIQQPFYSELRTKQQTGYIVHSWASELEQQLFTFFTVQSNTHNGRDLLARFELVIERFIQEMESEDLSPERFEIIRNSLVTQLQQAPRNLQEMTELLQLLAVDYNGDFDWVRKRIEGFDNLDYEVFTDYARNFLGRDNHRRLGLIVSGAISDEHRFVYSNVKNSRKMRKLSEYEARPPSCKLSSAR